MCNNGINKDQLQMSLEMLVQQTVLGKTWLDEISHLAGHAGLAGAEFDHANKSMEALAESLLAALMALGSDDDAPNYDVEVV
jgi:hypothetical protein